MYGEQGPAIKHAIDDGYWKDKNQQQAGSSHGSQARRMPPMERTNDDEHVAIGDLHLGRTLTVLNLTFVSAALALEVVQATKSLNTSTSS